jgi:hypothetical protein
MKVTEDQIWVGLRKQRKISKGKGYAIYVNDIVANASANNFYWFWGNAIWQDKNRALIPIDRFLQAGIPVIVCQSLRVGSKFGHFKVVTGLKKGKIFVNDPKRATGNHIMTLNKFLSLWKKITDEVTGETEVTGGLFLAIFPKNKKIDVNNLELSSFNASMKSFTIKEVDWN